MSLVQSAFRETILNLKIKPGARMVTLLMVALAFIVFNTFLIISFNLQTVLTREENLVGMEVFLGQNLTEQESRVIGDIISGMSGVQSVYFVSSQEAEALFRAELPNHTDLLDIMGSAFNLPPSLQISYDREVMDQDRIAELSRAIAVIEGVEDAVYGEDYLPGLVKTVNTIRKLVFLLGIVLVSSISMVVFFTVRFSIVRHSLTVELMRIVGAPRWFVRVPFVVEGIFVGVAGATGGLVMAAGLSQILSDAVVHRFMPVSWMLLVVLLGAITGVVGALAGSFKKER